MVRLILLAAALLAALPATAQQTEDRDVLVGREIDRYLRHPGSAGTYRALAGLGDPFFLQDVPSIWRGDWQERQLFSAGYNCRIGYAAEVYRERVAQFGENHLYVKRWLAAQKAAFAGCSGGRREQDRGLPPPLSSNDPEIVQLQVADRAYQQASMAFYNRDLAEARALFARIAASDGPHREAARLTAASIDAGSRPDYGDRPVPDAATIERALALAKDPTMGGMQSEAMELVGWMGANFDTPETRAAQVAVTLEALHQPIDLIRKDREAMERYVRAEQDLPRLYGRFDNEDWWLTGSAPMDHYASQAMAREAQDDRLAAFALAMEACRDGPCDKERPSWTRREFVRIAFETAEEVGDGDAWRVATSDYAWAVPDDWDDIDALLAALQRQPTAHDAALLGFLIDKQVRHAIVGQTGDRRRAMALLARYPYTEADHFQRLYADTLQRLAQDHRLGEARALRDAVEPRLTERWLIPADLLMLLAEDREEMVDAIVGYENSATPLLDRLSIDQIWSLARENRLAEEDRARFARLAWTRSFLVREKVARKEDTLMRSLNPVMTATWRTSPGVDADERELVIDMLLSPGLNHRVEARANRYGWYGNVDPPSVIDVYLHSVNNWWCRFDAAAAAEREERALSNAFSNGGDRPAMSKMLAESHVWQSLDRKERAALADKPMGPKMLAEAAIAWGRKADADDARGADEALALAVKATRYGCQMDGGHGEWSQAAYELLHKKWPDSEAAKRTRWWFDCKHFTYGCTDAPEDDQNYFDWEAWERERKERDERADEPPDDRDPVDAADPMAEVEMEAMAEIDDE